MTTAMEKRQSLRELRKSDKTLYARNNTNTKVTCYTSGPNGLRFELDPAGHPDSIRVMPKGCLDVPGFQRIWMRGGVDITDDEAMEDQILALMSGGIAGPAPGRAVQVQREDGTWTTEVPEMREDISKNSYVVPVDTDPESRTFGQAKQPTCLVGGERVFQTQKQIEEGQPPLCPQHLGEAHRVVSTPQPDGSWQHVLSRVVMEAPQRGV